MALHNVDTGEFSCPNPICLNFGLAGHGNIAVRSYYGKEKRPLLYCRICGKRFAATTGTAFYGAHLPHDAILNIIHHSAEGVGVRAIARLLDIDKDTVNDVIHRVGLHCARSLDRLLTSLSMTEDQLDELWAFIKKKRVMSFLKNSNQQNRLVSRITIRGHGVDESGPEQP
jgi:transposase-like protein